MQKLNNKISCLACGYVQGIGILFRSAKFSVHYFPTIYIAIGRPVLCYEILNKMADTRPISWPFKMNTTLISLNNNFGTL